MTHNCYRMKKMVNCHNNCFHETELHLYCCIVYRTYISTALTDLMRLRIKFMENIHCIYIVVLLTYQNVTWHEASQYISATVELNLGLMFLCVFFTAQVRHVNHTRKLHINNSQRKCKYACLHYRRVLQRKYNSISYVHFDSTD